VVFSVGQRADGQADGIRYLSCMGGIMEKGLKMKKEEILLIAKETEDLLVPFCSCGSLGLHGLSHLRRVAILSGRLASATGEDVEAAVVMGFLHDGARTDDKGGNGHAHDSAVLARQLLKMFYPHLEADRICDAIARHADGEVTGDTLTACLWDADRLELKRIGRTIDLDLLSTRVAKRLARARAARMVPVALEGRQSR